jgi:uncharacterized RDD family membrane protein YckC
MTRVDPRPGPPDAPLPEPSAGAPAAAPLFPWHAAPPPAPVGPSEREQLTGRPAGFVTRAAANATDVAVTLGVLALCYAAVAGTRFLLAPTSFRLVAPEFAWVVLAAGAGLALYWTAAWAGPGRTYGDRLMGLQVVGHGGGRVHVLHAAVRAVLCVLFLPGLFWVLVSRRNRSVQDLLVRTAVVYA